MRLFRKQFVIARAPFRFDETWTSRGLADGWTLSFQGDLDVSATPDAAGAPPAMILGDLYRYDPASGRGAGRYVEIRWPRLRTDPAALLGVFHGRIGDAFVVSSSPELAMRALTGEGPPPDRAFVFGHRDVMNYLPSPASPWAAIRRLLHDQAVDFAVSAPAPVPAIVAAEPGLARLDSFEAAAAALAEELCAFAGELKTRIPGRVFLPLTAGLDSRTLAAAFLATGLPFETTTMRFAGKPAGDVRIAAQISRRFGLCHHVIDPVGFDPDKAALLRRHISGTCVGWDLSHLVPGDAYRYQRAGDAMIPGACFEMAYYYDRRFAGFDFETATGAGLWRRLQGAPEGEAAGAAALDDWLAWRRAHPGTLSWSSQFYLDQRLGGWRAALEQGYDLLPGVSLSPANNLRILSALITPAAADRAARRLQKEVIRRLAPKLLAFPLNPPTFGARLERWGGRGAAAVLRRLWRTPGAATSPSRRDPLPRS